MEEHEESTAGGPSAETDLEEAPGYRPRENPKVPKRPGLAAFLSIFPGIGHVYCGLYSRALMFFAAFLGSIQMIDSAGSPIFGMSLIFFWIFGLIDAYRQATLMNLGYAADTGVAPAPRVGKPGQELLVTGVVLFSLGFLELLSRLGLWNWDLLADHAYLLLMVVGGWLVVNVLLSRRGARRKELSEALSDL